MERSPYQVLGVSENATPDEIKKAYRKKARENHPDLNPGDAAAAERMNEINEAYDRLTNPEKYEQRERATRGSSGAGGAGWPPGQGGYGYQGSAGYQGTRGSSSQGAGQQGYSGPYGWASDFGFDFDDLFGAGFGTVGATVAAPEASATDSDEVRRAIAFINSKRHAQAVAILNAIPSYGRDARWHYLAALANHGAGNEMLALDQIRRACQMDPGNMTYQQAMRAMRQPATSYQQQSEQQGFSVGFVDPLTMCCGCIAVQSCCFPMVCFRPC